MVVVLTSDPDVNPAFPVKFFLQSWTSPNTNQDVPPFSINPDTGNSHRKSLLNNLPLPELIKLSFVKVIEVIQTQRVGCIWECVNGASGVWTQISRGDSFSLCF